MVVVTVPDKKLKIEDPEKARKYLAEIGITYEKWGTGRQVDAKSSSEDILEAYSEEIERLKQSGGYTTADVIDLTEKTPGLDAMLAKFNKEHWHSEDEVRFTISGRGVFHIHPENSDVVAVEVSEGDLLRVPNGTKHWFDLCGDKNIRAIRLFQDMSGWTPYYVKDGVDGNYEPLCLGPAYFRPNTVR